MTARPISFELESTLEECRTAQNIGPLNDLLRSGWKPSEYERELIDALPFGPMTPAAWVQYQADALALNRTLRDDGMKPPARRAEVFKRYPLMLPEFLDRPSPTVRAKAESDIR